MLIVPSDAQLAIPLLTQVREQRMHCTMFVLADTEAARILASKADVRAEHHPYRKVVWAPARSGLEAAPGYEALVTKAVPGVAAIAMTFDFRFACSLAEGEDSFLKIEQAFILAMQATA